MHVSSALGDPVHQYSYSSTPARIASHIAAKRNKYTIWLFLRNKPWPSGNTLDSDQYGPGFEAHRRPLVTSGSTSGSKCLS